LLNSIEIKRSLQLISQKGVLFLRFFVLVDVELCFLLYCVEEAHEANAEAFLLGLPCISILALLVRVKA
jgi:hypothetical protein